MWYVIKSKPRQESNLYKLISHYNVFYPRYKKQILHMLLTSINISSFIPNDILKDVNYLKYTRGLHSFLRVNDTYQSISDYMERLQSFFDDNGVLLFEL